MELPTAKQADAHIRHHGGPHPSQPQNTQHHDQNFDAQNKNDVLHNDALCGLGKHHPQRNGQRISLHHHYVSRLKSRIGPYAAHGNADVGSSEGRGVIHTVPHKGKQPRFRFQPAHMLQLAGRHQPAEYPVHPQLKPHFRSGGRRIPVSMTRLETPSSLNFRTARSAPGLTRSDRRRHPRSMPSNAA